MQDLYNQVLYLKKSFLVFFLIFLISSIVLADNLVEPYNDPLTISLGNSLWCQLTGCNYSNNILAPDFLFHNGSSCCQGGASGVTSVTATSPIVSSGGATPVISWNPINIALGWFNLTNIIGNTTNDFWAAIFNQTWDIRIDSIDNHTATVDTFNSTDDIWKAIFNQTWDTRIDSINNLSNSSILDLTSVYNDTEDILWENSTGVIKSKSSQDLNMQDGDISIKDSDGEFHNISRDLQISDEMTRNITLSGLNGSLASDGNLTITTITGENIAVNIDKSESILDRNTDSIIITSGTNESPILNQMVYINSLNPVLAKRTTLGLKAPSVAAFLQGANFTYVSAIGLATIDNLVGGLFNRFFRDGSTYRSGFEINVSSNMVNISTGVISFLFSEIDIIQNHSTSDFYVHVHTDGSFHQHDSLDDCDSYNDGSAISNNKYFNVVFGIAITHDGAGVMYAVTQDLPSTEYIRAIDAEVDLEDTINFFPPDDIVSLAYIPVVRIVVRLSGGVNTIQTLSNGALFDDLRGTITKTSSSPPPSGITSHSDLTNLPSSVSDHTQDNNFNMNDFNITNVNTINSSSVFANNLSGNLSWNNLYGYPNACSSNKAITQLGDTLTCTEFAPPGGNATPWNLSGTTIHQADFSNTLEIAVADGGLEITDTDDSRKARVILGHVITGGNIQLKDNSDTIRALIRGYEFANTQAYFIAGYVGIGLTDPTHLFEVDGNVSLNKTLYVVNDNVGIGTTTPTSKLHVIGNADITGNILSGDDLVFTTSGIGIRTNSTNGADNYFSFLTAGGGTGVGRGGAVLVYGNEHPDLPGKVILAAGNSLGAIDLITGTSGANVTIFINGVERGRFTDDGFIAGNISTDILHYNNLSGTGLCPGSNPGDSCFNGSAFIGTYR